MNEYTIYIFESDEQSVRERWGKRKLKRTEPKSKTCVRTERFWATVEIRNIQWGQNVGRFEISYSFIDSDAPFQSWKFVLVYTLQLRNSWQVV